MKIKIQINLISILLLINSCIVPYYPQTTENEELLIVEGVITDQHEINTIKLHMSVPLWKISNEKPLKGCKVWISDDMGKVDSMKEASIGTYVTSINTFQGKTGRKYILHIITPEAYRGHSYESLPMEMKPVPPIDDISYEKKAFITNPRPIEGCEIYVNTYDPTDKCKFYKWKYSETWEFHLPFDVQNKVCWITSDPDKILIKNTSILGEDRVSGFPINSIENPVDKLSVKYSILVTQYSLNEDEFNYWESLKNTLDQIGSLYDIIPAAIPNNIYCIEDPNEKTLGYFSVSAVTSKRAFIKDDFAGSNINMCMSDTIFGSQPLDLLGIPVWVVSDHLKDKIPYRIVTYSEKCTDCRLSGTDIKPDFWDDDKYSK
jgi:hypothetical protein